MTTARAGFARTTAAATPAPTPALTNWRREILWDMTRPPDARLSPGSRKSRLHGARRRENLLDRGQRAAVALLVTALSLRPSESEPLRPFGRRAEVDVGRRPDTLEEIPKLEDAVAA